MSAIDFKINTGQTCLWKVLSKNKYDDSLQPLLELLDNSFAADSHEIRLQIDFIEKKCSIEDDGRGLPIDSAGLSRCFSYGEQSPTDLNEHGCGMKSSLAILDPTDTNWSVRWKRDGKKYCVQAPYSITSHQAKIETLWIGDIQKETGTLIMFPLAKDTLSALYASKDAKMADDDVIMRLRNEFAHYWMKYPKFMDRDVKLYVNGDQVIPFKMPESYQFYETLPKIHKNVISTGATVNVEIYKLKESIKDSRWFKKSMTSNGFYIYKNGRLIQRINSGKLYKRLCGTAPHNNHNGFIVIINIAGTQSQCPVTVPTKNKFNEDDIFEEVCTYVYNLTHKLVLNEKDESEESKLEKFHTTRITTFQELEGYSFRLNESIKYDGLKFSAPQIDGIEEVNNTMTIYEAKRGNIPSLPDIIQLYGNWILASVAVDNSKSKKPVLLIDAAKGFKLDDKLKHTVEILNENLKIGFPLEIWNYASDKLFMLKR